MLNMSFIQRQWLVAVLILCLALISIAPAAAQVPPTPITSGENRTGDLNGSTPSAVYSLSSSGSETVIVQVLAITPGLNPTVRVQDPSGVLVADIPNSGAANIVQTSVTLSTPGVYLIEVRSATNALGQFVISVQAGAPLAPPTPLVLGAEISGIVNAQIVQQSYSFAASPQAPLLLHVSAEGEAAPVVMLFDQANPQPIAVSGAQLLGARYPIPAGGSSYIVRVSHSGALAAVPYTVCVEIVGSGLCPDPFASSAPQTIPTVVVIPTQAAAVPTQPPVVVPTVNVATIPPNVCAVSPAGGSAINVRSLATTASTIVGTLPAGQTLVVTGRTSDNAWFRVNYSGLIAWVASSVAIATGNCAGIQIVATPFPTLTPTSTFTRTFTPTIPLVSATPTPSLTPSQPAPQPTLNFSLPPNSGSTSLTSGFVPDPFSIGISSGGSVNVSYLGGGCTGFATSAPDFSIFYTSGAFPLLRFYYIGSSDATLIINTPSGNYVCNDDSYGTLNPTIDFNGPVSGRYDVWIGSFSSGGGSSGMLFVTENSGNHP
jgi:hypothetical protein